ncbi:hypothetical protein SAMN05444161_0540 [Rhizobiales bacterium GAS191]|jgi:hypothetical protein|nr:hypothetical protein SAMN05519103_08028 [Rhizobiales bacterium GAS113]SEC11766.1 hypothetical protein SAMN05444161_0540 [Rhizobiales bacterium GAS191]SED08642.1 hypothetical protein SAMN05519104_2762 [Rhizobiales bacterium GAS188]
MFFTPFGYLAAFSAALRMANDVAVTVAARSSILAQAAIFPERPLDPEIPRMMSEKLSAVIEGAIGAQHEFAYLAASAMRGDSLPTLMRQTTAVGMAGLRPARRAVRANAKRLSRKT